MKSIQNTTLSCGLLTAPVKIFPAAGREPEVQFNLITPDGEPIERIYVEREEPDVQQWTADHKRRMVNVIDYDDLGRAYDGTLINSADLAAAEEESLTSDDGTDLKLITVEQFVPLKDLPMERTTKLYYLGPDSKVSTKSFKTFKEGLKSRKAAAIAKVVLRSRQMLFAIYVKDEIVHAAVLSFSATMNDRTDSDLFSDVDVKRPEVNMMGKLIDTMMGDASVIDEAEDTYVVGKRELVEKLASGKEPVQKKTKRKTKANDSLLESLEASVAAAQEKVKV